LETLFLKRKCRLIGRLLQSIKLGSQREKLMLYIAKRYSIPELEGHFYGA